MINEEGTNTPQAILVDALANEVLTSIEIAESSLLNWGFIPVANKLDQQFQELISRLSVPGQALWVQAQEEGISAVDVFRNLVERKLLFKNKEEAYRSRFTEAIRLLALLRQRFSDEDWQSAPKLVSDFKIQLQRRRYPKRDIDPAWLQQQLQAEGVRPLQREAVAALLTNPDGSELRLAAFQQEAIAQQFRNLQERGDRGMVIGAGTGAGKTKAFYIPALSEIAATITADRWVRAIAIYPRVELLKDQLSEALSETAKLSSYLKNHNRRQIVLGAYFGDTPASAHMLLHGSRGWKQVGRQNDYVCPFLNCPEPACNASALLWDKADVEQEAAENRREVYGRFARLRCHSCGFEVGSDRLLLTREHMRRQPPDLLFTTTEMLNRRLSNAREHALFGVAAANPPRLMLLDEIHTYEGITGAQVAYLLRRWRHARGGKQGLSVVGLSATLAQAEEFFAKLTGVPQHQVRYIYPREADLVEEGIEYNLVIKGDPVSGTSLLSTSVQTAMLLGRIMDPAHKPVSKGAYGQRLFAFTDKLDVINRWYHTEIDAETRKRLSKYRELSPKLDRAAKQKRQDEGQSWWVCERIGHNLQDPLRLGLTSSQHRGVAAEADLVIATATLEVGYNDPTVGAVLQHKAPRSLASFLQRKGRAGRTRGMRPWMVVVTSAYGRDRWAFQHIENLFTPHLEPLSLPIENYYVRKIQATFALMDWLSHVAGQDDNVWSLLSSEDRGQKPALNAGRARIRSLLQSLLDGTRLPEFSQYLRQALGLQDDARALVAILWGDPRPLLLEVIPTVLRQLEGNWQSLAEGTEVPWTDAISGQPMPDFVPATLFTDLNLPEIRLHVPNPPSDPTKGNHTSGMSKANTPMNQAPAQQDEPLDEYLPLGPALIEFAPGNVSKRYASKYRTTEAHWLEIPEQAEGPDSTLSLEALQIERDIMALPVAVDGVEYQVFRPRAYSLSHVPTKVKSTSTARLRWRSFFTEGLSHASSPEAQAESKREGRTLLALVPSSPWNELVQTVSSYTQVNGSWVDVTRLAVGVQLDTRLASGAERRYELRFVESARPAALGFTTAADALAFRATPFDVRCVVEHPSWPDLYGHLNSEYFLYKIQQDDGLRSLNLSTFVLRWLWELERSMLIAVAVATQCTLPEAADRVDQDRERIAERTMKVIFQSQQGDIDGDEDEDGAGRLHQKLRQLISNPLVIAALRQGERVLWEFDVDDLSPWLETCYRSSLGAALFTALGRLIPDLDTDELVMDIQDDTIWISETTSGGVGLVSRIAEALSLRPRDFELQLMDTVQNCDREQTALQLEAVAGIISGQGPALAEALGKIREASDLPTQTKTRLMLMRALEEHGIPATRDLIVAMNAKILRPNSGPDSDDLIATLVRCWSEQEQRIGTSIDLRVMAVAAQGIPEIKQKLDQVLRRIGGSKLPDESQIFNLLQSMLWLTCHDSCPDCIETWQPYQEYPHPSRALLRMLLRPQERPIQFGEDGWLDLIQQQLSYLFHTQVECEQDALEQCKLSLLDLLVTPVEVGYQLLYPMIERIGRAERRWRIDLVIAEMVRG